MRSSNASRILVFAGPNGSGKSTVTRAWEKYGLYINADDIKETRGCSDLEAALEAERLRELCLSERRSFTFETVLSTERNLDLLSRAKAAGYHIESVFVLTANPELNVFRVKMKEDRVNMNDVYAKLAEAEEDIIAGRVSDARESLGKLREKHGLKTEDD